MPVAQRASQSIPRQGVLTGTRAAPRPPWSTEALVRSNCTSCGECLRACPESILVAGPAGTPTVDFTRGECTFCAACADACPENVFTDTGHRPWSLTARIGEACLLKAKVSCRSCVDACDAQALRCTPQVGGFGAIQVDSQSCTGCGACVGTCPVGAIAVTPATSPALEPAK